MPLAAAPDFLPALPEIALAIAAMALLLVGVFRGEGSTRLVSWLAVLVLIGILILAARIDFERQTAFYGMFITDGFALFMKTLVLVGSAVSIVMAMRYNEEHQIARFEFPVLILLATTGMMVMVSANDLLTLYLGLELQSLALYVSPASTGIRSAPAKPASSISCSARCRPGCCFTAPRWSTASPAPRVSRRSPR
jgi:NADH-quinone oxidoreductase subunit N